MAATLRKIVTDIAVKDKAYIDDLLKSSGILKTMRVIPSSDGAIHKYKKVNALPAGSFRNHGTAYAASKTVNDDIAQIGMKILGNYQSEDKVICDQKGKLKYFLEHRPAFMEGMGQSLVTQNVYGTVDGFGNVAGWKGWHERAKEIGGNNDVDAGGASGSSTTLFVVKYSAQSGLVLDSSFMNAGSLFQTTAVGGGTVQMVGGLPSYQVLYEGSMALLSGGVYDVARIHSIDSSHKPTATQIKTAIRAVRGKADGSTFIYVNGECHDFVTTLKETPFRMGAMDTNFNVQFDYFNNIPMVIDDNILNTETSALD